MTPEQEGSSSVSSLAHLASEITTTSSLSIPDATMSKNQQKKLARKQRLLERRPEIKKLEKEKRRRKRQELAKLRLEGEITGAILNVKPKIKLMSESSNKYRIVIDMDFENLMTDEEIAKAAKQVGRIYSINRHSESPCQLHVSSLKGKIRDRFAITNAGYKNWDLNITDQDYIDLFVNTSVMNKCDSDLGQARDDVKKNIIYLTGDSEDKLPDVSEILANSSTIFVIGGLVDHNRYKNLCYDRARERNLRTAQLPIRDYVKLCHRHILSTVTVFEIMLNVLAGGKSWREAFLDSIPKRKLKQETEGEM